MVGQFSIKRAQQIVGGRDRGTNGRWIGTVSDVELGGDELVSQIQAGIAPDWRVQDRQQFRLGVILASQSKRRDRPNILVILPIPLSKRARACWCWRGCWSRCRCWCR